MAKIKRFLLTDDDKDDRDLFSEALSSIDPGIVYHWAEDGKQALRMLDSKTIEKPDIIFLDINMPVMNGWELLDKLKQNSAYKDVPVIMYTTSSEERDRKTAMDLGALCFITKPDNFKSIKSILQVVINNLDNGSLWLVTSDIEKLFETRK